jgi:hypothetical protein
MLSHLHPDRQGWAEAHADLNNDPSGTGFRAKVHHCPAEPGPLESHGTDWSRNGK